MIKQGELEDGHTEHTFAALQEPKDNLPLGFKSASSSPELLIM